MQNYEIWMRWILGYLIVGVILFVVIHFHKPISRTMWSRGIVHVYEVALCMMVLWPFLWGLAFYEAIKEHIEENRK